MIAGANNVGKSTILESIFLFMGRYTGDVFLLLNKIRGITNIGQSPQLAWESLFYNQNVLNEIIIKLQIDDHEQIVTISKEDIFYNSPNIESVKSQMVPVMNSSFIPGYHLKVNFFDGKNNDLVYFVINDAETIKKRLPDIYSVNIPFTYYLHTMSIMDPQQVVELYSQLEKNYKKNSLINILKLLDDRIKDLSILVIGGVIGLYADLGLETKLSINVLGDGINKLMHIILVMLANPGAIILADEIENGFHYSFYPKLWEIIGNLTQKTNCQLIATSHSYECINAAENLAIESDMFRFLRLEKVNGTIHPKVFDNEAFMYSINNDWEVR